MQVPAPWLHQETARRLAERLAIILRPPLRVIDWSGAGGGSSQALAQACPRAAMSVVGTATGETTRSWWRRWSGLRPVTSYSQAEVPPAAFDMVWSNMALQWEPVPQDALARWRAALADDGFLMFSTVGPGTLSRLRAVYRDAGWGSPMAPLVDMHDLGDMLVHGGFADPVMDQETLTLTWDSAEAALAELRSLGANADPARSVGCRTPAWRLRLLAALRDTAGPDGRIRLDFELVYGHAYRARDAGPRVSPNTEIGLDAMKLMLRKPQSRQ